MALARVHNGDQASKGAVEREIAKGRYVFPKDVEIAAPRTNGDLHRVPRVGESQAELYCGAERLAPFLFLGAIHREDFDAVGGYDETRKDRNDEDLANRLIARGVRFRFVGQAVAFHLSHGKT